MGLASMRTTLCLLLDLEVLCSLVTVHELKGNSAVSSKSDSVSGSVKSGSVMSSFRSRPGVATSISLSSSTHKPASIDSEIFY